MYSRQEILLQICSYILKIPNLIHEIQKLNEHGDASMDITNTLLQNLWPWFINFSWRHQILFRRVPYVVFSFMWWVAKKWPSSSIFDKWWGLQNWSHATRHNLSYRTPIPELSSSLLSFECEVSTGVSIILNVRKCVCKHCVSKIFKYFRCRTYLLKVQPFYWCLGHANLYLSSLDILEAVFEIKRG